MTRCSLGAGCNTCMGLPREGQAVVAFPSASTLPISEYHKLETLQALPRWLTADTKPNACSHSSAISTRQRRGQSTWCPPPHSPWWSRTRPPQEPSRRGLPKGGCQKGAARSHPGPSRWQPPAHRTTTKPWVLLRATSGPTACPELAAWGTALPPKSSFPFLNPTRFSLSYRGAFGSGHKNKPRKWDRWKIGNRQQI